MSQFRIASLGEPRFNSPVHSSVFVNDLEAVLVDCKCRVGETFPKAPVVMEQAGPRRKIFFEPRTTRAAVVTCGGLCPGLNDVVRAITMVLWYHYGVRDIQGLRYGYEGLVTDYSHEVLKLTPEAVEDIHQDGGTILGSSRGPQDVGRMVDYLSDNFIDILFTIGGDGTLRGGLAIAEEVKKRGLNIAVIGVPKTIDNDILYTERTFGFVTAVAESRGPITAAHMEAKGAKNGIGLVKLMGRESGFLAAHATMASSDVNLLLIPEAPFSLDLMLEYLHERLVRKSHAVVVVAEGAGQEFVQTGKHDPSGNKKLGDIGLFLKQSIEDYFRSVEMEFTIKYIDPSYTIRSAPATADDSVFCFRLGQHAVHAAMSGRTGMVVGLWNGHFVHVPIERAVERRKQIDIQGLFWQSVLNNTGQPRDLV